jgi:hypothetical protein
MRNPTLPRQLACKIIPTRLLCNVWQYCVTSSLVITLGALWNGSRLRLFIRLRFHQLVFFSRDVK